MARTMDVSDVRRKDSRRIAGQSRGVPEQPKGTRGMAKHKTNGGQQGTLEPLSTWKRHQALQELARFMVQEGHTHLTQLEYDLAEEKAYSVQFFVRHWGSWARAVEKARDLMEQQDIPEPQSSPYAGLVNCLCGKACHCEKRFWSPDRRKIRMCDACRAWSDKLSVDDQFFYLTDETTINTRGRTSAAKQGRPKKDTLRVSVK